MKSLIQVWRGECKSDSTKVLGSGRSSSNPDRAPLRDVQVVILNSPQLSDRPVLVVCLRATPRTGADCC